MSQKETPQKRVEARPPDRFDVSPFLAFWEVTQACDLACQHCRAHAKPERDPLELSTEEGRELLRSIHAMGCPAVILTGGDPAKRADLVELVRFGTRIGLKVALTPSATPLVTPHLIRRLADAGLSRIAISIDGVDAATHDEIRGVPGSYVRSFEILRAARDVGMSTQVNTVVSRTNGGDLERFARQLAPEGIQLWSVFFLVPVGRADQADMMSAEEVEQTLVQLAQLSVGSPFDIKTTAAPHFRRVLLQRRVRERRVVGVVRGIGRAPRGIGDGRGIVFVSRTGQVSPSGFLPVDCGSVREEDLQQIYRTHPLFLALRDPDRLEGKCGACEFRRVCGGSRARAHAVTGDAFAEDPSCTYQPKGWASEEERRGG